MGRPAEEIILGAEGKHPGPAAVSHVHYNQRPHHIPTQPNVEREDMTGDKEEKKEMEERLFFFVKPIRLFFSSRRGSLKPDEALGSTHAAHRALPECEWLVE